MQDNGQREGIDEGQKEGKIQKPKLTPFFLFQFDFVGRILGPRGMTTKQLEQETGCKIMVRCEASLEATQ